VDHSDGRALVVEDDQGWQQILSEILNDAGLEVDLAEDLETAVIKLRAAPHLVAVVDLSLDSTDHHNQDGLHVLDALRRHDPNCLTLLLTGLPTAKIADSALNKHGAFACLHKENFRRAEFREVVSRAIVG
jgi:ActR/RegA family two-component response regulator